jgi:hypothetical protein
MVIHCNNRQRSGRGRVAGQEYSNQIMQPHTLFSATPVSTGCRGGATMISSRFNGFRVKAVKTAGKHSFSALDTRLKPGVAERKL